MQSSEKQSEKVQDHIQNTLQPLQKLGMHASREYLHLLQEMQEIDRQFRNIESCYASSYRRAAKLEKQVAVTQKDWSNS